MQTQTSNTLHNAIMEAGSKDRPPMLAPGNYVQWKSRIKRYIDTKPNHELIHYCLENPPYKLDWQDIEVLVSEGSPITTTERIRETYKNVSQNIRDQLNAKAEKAIERLKQGELINVQDLETNLYWEFGKFTSQDEWQRFVTLVKQSQELKTVSYHKLYDILKQHQHKVNEIRAEKIARVANPLALVAQQQLAYHLQNHPTHYTQNSSTRSQQAATRNREKAIVKSPQPIYDQEPSMVAEDEETSKDKEIDKLMVLISLSFKKIYKPTNNNLRTSSNTSRVNQDNSLRINRNAGYENQRIGNVAGAKENAGSSVVQKSRIQCFNCKEFGHEARECQKPKRAKDAAYHREKMLLCKQEEAGIQLNAEQDDWRDDTDDDELKDQELEAHYMYMVQLQEVSLDAADSGPIFDDEPLQKVSNDDHYNVFAMESTHPEQSKSVHDTYPIEQDAQNVIVDSLDMNHDREETDQDDDDNDLAKERELLASLIEKLKCEIDESKNRNKFFKEANNKLSETNNLLYADYKRSEAELVRCNSTDYASQMELKCAKVRGDLLSYKMDYHKSSPDSDEVIRLEKESRSKLSDLIRPFDYDKLNNLCLNEEMVADLRYFNSLESEVDSLRSQLETQKTQFFNEIDRLFREYYYADHMNAILSVHIELDEVTNLQCDYLELLEKCEGLETELSKSVPLCQILHCLLILLQLVEIVLFIVDSGCSKYMMGNVKLLINFVEKFLRTVKFGNDQIAPILGYGDLVQGAVTIKRVYYVEGLNYNLFSVGSRGTNLYSVTLQDTNCPNPICLMAKNDIVVGLPKLKFVKDHLCSSCELGKAKRKSFHTKLTPSSKRRLQLLHIDLCGPMQIASINGKRYVLVIVDDYSRYTWTYFFRSKDKTPEVLIDFLRLVQRGLQAQVRVVRTDKGMEFLNQTLYAYFAAEGILHQTSVARIPEQNGVVKRQNRTLVEVARTMLSTAKIPLFFWAEAIATACFTQNRSLVIPRHEKTPYHIINDQKPSVKFFHIFGSVCYIVRDGENLDKMKEKGDECIFVGYSNQSRAYRVFNKRTRVIMESIHVNFKELPQMASDQLSFDPALECQTMALNHDSLSLAIQCQANVPQADRTVVSKSSDVSAANAPYQRQQYTTLLNIHTTPSPTCQAPPLAPTVSSSEHINQAETYAENDQFADDEFINIFSTPVQDQGETSSRHVDS
nr:hypothetical protein [Tanacetum cinerariifolium]